MSGAARHSGVGCARAVVTLVVLALGAILLALAAIQLPIVLASWISPPREPVAIGGKWQLRAETLP